MQLFLVDLELQPHLNISALSSAYLLVRMFPLAIISGYSHGVSKNAILDLNLLPGFWTRENPIYCPSPSGLGQIREAQKAGRTNGPIWTPYYSQWSAGNVSIGADVILAHNGKTAKSTTTRRAGGLSVPPRGGRLLEEPPEGGKPKTVQNLSFQYNP